MKRIFAFGLALLIGTSVLFGCSGPAGLGGDAQATPDLTNASFDFDSYREMMDAFGGRGSEDAREIRSLKDQAGEPYGAFLDRVDADGAFPHPMQEGEPMAYRDEEGFSNITFFADELYDLPWVWYHPHVATGENYYIKITYVPAGVAQGNQTASEVIAALSPNAANVGNLGKHHKSIENRQIRLADREVTATVFEYKDDARCSVMFVYGDLLVEVRGNPDLWDEAWFATLSFEAP